MNPTIFVTHSHKNYAHQTTVSGGEVRQDVGFEVCVPNSEDVTHTFVYYDTKGARAAELRFYRSADSKGRRNILWHHYEVRAFIRGEEVAWGHVQAKALGVTNKSPREPYVWESAIRCIEHLGMPSLLDIEWADADYDRSEWAAIVRPFVANIRMTYTGQGYCNTTP